MMKPFIKNAVVETPATMFFIAVNIVIMLLMMVSSGNYNEQTTQTLYAWGGLYPDAPIYTWVAHTFLHASLLHIVMNMSALLVYGRSVEKMIGSINMFIGYLLFSAIIGTILAYTISGNKLLIGASSIVCAFIAFKAIGYFMKKEKTQEDKKAIKYTMFDIVMINLIGLIPVVSALGHFVGLAVGAGVSVVYFAIKNAADEKKYKQQIVKIYTEN